MQPRPEEIHLLDYWRIISNRRHLTISFFILVVGIVTVYSYTATPIYESTAKLLFNQQNNTTLSFTEGGSPLIQIKEPTEYYNTQKKIIFSRTFIDHVIRKNALDTNSYFVNKKKKTSGGPVASLRRLVTGILSKKKADPVNEESKPLKDEVDPWLTSFLLDRMKVVVGRDSSIMEIQFTSDDSGIAAFIANCIADTYIQYNLDLRVMPYKDSVGWLSARLSEFKTKVETSEKSLQRYKEQKNVVSFEARENIITQKLHGLVSELVRVQGARQEAEIRYNQIKDVIDNPELLARVPDIMNNQVIQSLRNQELNLQRQLSEMSEKFGPKHPQIVQTNSELEMVKKSLNSEARKMLSSAKTIYEIALNREKFLIRSIEEEKQEVLGLSREMIDFKVVSEESENNRRFYEMLLKKLQEATLLSGITVSNIQVIDRAIPPGGPIKPNRSKNILLSIIIGVFGGIFLAIFTDYMDDSVKSQDDVDIHLGQHFLGMVPSAEQSMFSDPLSTVSESYRTIRMGIKFAASQRPLKTILITSAVPSEGKTTTASNLAIVLARMGERTLLIDADLRRQSIHKHFKLDNSAGLGSIIVEKGDLFSAIKEIEIVPHLSVLPGGPTFPNPSEVLASERMRDLISSLREKYDRIIIDSPPIMPVSDPLIVGGLADGVIMVSQAGSTGKAVVKKACQSLMKLNVHIIGIVLNKVRVRKRGYGYYYYYHNYYYSNYRNDSSPKRKEKTA